MGWFNSNISIKLSNVLTLQQTELHIFKSSGDISPSCKAGPAIPWYLVKAFVYMAPLSAYAFDS